MGSVGLPPSSSAQLGSDAQSPVATAPVQPEDDSFASTNPSFRQQTSRLAVVHAMVQHEQDTAEHRKKTRAKERGGAKIHPVQKSILEPHQSQGSSNSLAQGHAAADPSKAAAVYRPGDGASVTDEDSKAAEEDEDELATLMNRMDIDEAGSEPGLSESATTVSRGTPMQSPTTVHSNASIAPNRSPKSPTPWRPPVNYLSKPAMVKHDQPIPSLSSPPTSPHRLSPFARRPNFGPPQRPVGAAPAFTPMQTFPAPGHVQLPPVQPLMSPFTTPPASAPIWTPQGGTYFWSPQFPPPVPGTPGPAAFPHFGPQAPNFAPPGAVDPHAPEFVPRWKMDGNQRFSGRARPFQRLLDDYQRVQGGQQNKQQELQLQLQLALQLQANSPQDASDPAAQSGSPMQAEDPARRLALQRALAQAMPGASFGPAPAAAPPPVDEERRMALQNALQRAMGNQTPVTPPQQYGTVQNWPFPGTPFSQTPQHSPQRFAPPPGSPGPFAPPSPTRAFSPSPTKGFPSSPSKGFPSSPSKGFPPSPSKGFPPSPSKGFP